MIKSFEAKQDNTSKSFKELGKVSRKGALTPSSNESGGRRKRRKREGEGEEEKEEGFEGFMIEWRREEEEEGGKEENGGKEKKEERGEKDEEGGGKKEEEKKGEEGEGGGKKKEERGERKEEEKKKGIMWKKERKRREEGGKRRKGGEGKDDEIRGRDRRVKMEDSSNMSSEQTDLPGCRTREDSPILTLREKEKIISRKVFLKEKTNVNQNDQFFKVSPPSYKGQRPSPHRNSSHPYQLSVFSSPAPSSPPHSFIDPSPFSAAPPSSLHSPSSSSFPIPPPSTLRHPSPSYFLPLTPSSVSPPPSSSFTPFPPSSLPPHPPYRSFYYLKTSFKTEDILNSSFESIHREKNILQTEKKTFGHRRWEEMRELIVLKGTREKEKEWKEDDRRMKEGGRKMEGGGREEGRSRKDENSRCPCYNNCRIM